MASKLPPLIYRDWQNGVNDSVSNFLLPDNYLRRCINGNTDESDDNLLGHIQQRKGYTALGNQLQSGKNILGLANFVDKTTSPVRLITTVNNPGDTQSLTYYLNGSTWEQIGPVPTNWTASLKMRFDTFLDYVFTTNGTDTVRTWNGDTTTNWGTTEATSAQTGTLIKNFFDRMNVGGNSTYPSRLYYSTQPNSTNNITWSGSYIDFNPDDNDQMTALESTGGLLLVFKRRGLFTWDGLQTTPDKMIDYGTPSQETVQSVRGNTYFVSEVKGSWAIMQYAGDYPQEISRPIRKWISASGTTGLGNFGSFQDEDHVYFSVGDTTYEGVSYANICHRYCISKGTLTTYSLADKPLVYAPRVDSNNARTVVFGDDNGYVHTWGSGNTDNGTAISTMIRTKELEFGSRYLYKTINAFAVYSQNPIGATVRVRIDGGQWLTLGALQKPVELIKCNIRGHWFEFEVGCVNTQTPFTFEGIEFFERGVKIDSYDY